MDKDEYFKDFTLLDWRFIVINRKSLTPLVWEWESTTEKGVLTYGKNSQIELRDPQDIGEELNSYLVSRPRIPVGITENSSNDLNKWLLNLL